jgi:methionine aminopeptidase
VRPHRLQCFRSVCTSINEVICHGIPDRRPLEEGDIVNVDVSVYYKGYHGGRDTAVQLPVQAALAAVWAMPAG